MIKGKMTGAVNMILVAGSEGDHHIFFCWEAEITKASELSASPSPPSFPSYSLCFTSLTIIIIWNWKLKLFLKKIYLFSLFCNFFCLPRTVSKLPFNINWGHQHQPSALEKRPDANEEAFRRNSHQWSWPTIRTDQRTCTESRIYVIFVYM